MFLFFFFLLHLCPQESAGDLSCLSLLAGGENTAPLRALSRSGICSSIPPSVFPSLKHDNPQQAEIAQGGMRRLLFSLVFPQHLTAPWLHGEAQRWHGRHRGGAGGAPSPLRAPRPLRQGQQGWQNSLGSGWPCWGSGCAERCFFVCFFFLSPGFWCGFGCVSVFALQGESSCRVRLGDRSGRLWP